MSKLAKAVEDRVLNTRRPAVLNSELFNSSIEYITEPSINPSLEYKVRFKATLGMEVYIREDLLDSDYKKLVGEQITKSIIQEVFGEFRDPIRDIINSVMNEINREEIIHKLVSLEKQMFSV